MEKLVVSEALEYLSERMPLAYIAERMAINNTVLTHAKKHSIVHDKPYYLPPEKTELLRQAVANMGKDLLNTRLDPNYGEYADQLQELKRCYINVKYLTVKLLGKSYQWMNRRMCHLPYTDRLGRVKDYYNTFTDKDIKGINSAIHTLALEVLSIEILDEYPPEIEQQRLLSNMDITSAYELKSDEELQLLEDEMALEML